MNERYEQRFTLYLLGELSPAEATALEAELAHDEIAQAELEQMERLLADLDTTLVAPVDADTLADTVVAKVETVELRRKHTNWRWFGMLGIAASLLLAVGAWQFWFADDPPVVAQLVDWQITPTGNAQYKITGTNVVRLDRGELLIESLHSGDEKLKRRSGEQTPLRITTPEGEAIARGTRFFIGAHRPSTSEESRGMLNSTLTRVLVLSGMVTLTTSLGSVDGREGELLTTVPRQAPTKHAVQANSDFAFDLYQKLAKENDGKNVFFSPYSISTVLAMAAEGARGQTAKEMGDVLRFPDAVRRHGADAQLIPWETAQIHTGMAHLNQLLSGETKGPAYQTMKAKIAKLQVQLAALNARIKVGDVDAYIKGKEVADEINNLSSQIGQYEINVANAVWTDKTFPIKETYVNRLERHYKVGGAFPVDFRNNYPAARDEIDAWCATQTMHRIKKVMPTQVLRDLRLVLTNAIYFKADWKVPFEVKYTESLPFQLASHEKTKTPIMRNNLEVARYAAFNADGSFFKTPEKIEWNQKTGLYPDVDGFAMLELPYRGDDLSMVVIAPNRAGGLGEIEAKLTPANVANWISNLKQRETEVYLPKFKLETTYHLNEALKALGMNLAFTERADLSGMTDSKSMEDRLHVGIVLHKAFAEVNEKGTEAAAVTSLGGFGGAAPPQELIPFIPEFKADRPFVYLIRENSTGTILFMGRMNDPTK